MKKKIIVSAIFFVSLCTACNEEFLDRPDLDNITSSNFWKTPQDLELYATQFYGDLPGWSPGDWNGGIYWDDDNSDNIVGNNATSSSRITGNNTVGSDNSLWGNTYRDIRSINIFMENYENVEAGFDVYKHYVGEVLFFRAWMHFELMKNYGDIPWVDKALLPDSPELKNSRDSRNVVVDNILKDLDLAVEYMNSGKNAGGNRLSKECAKLLKARVALFEGTWEKYHSGTDFGVAEGDGSNYLTVAATTAKDLIDNPGGFGIHNTGNPALDYTTLFNQTDYSSNPEVMLWRQFSTGENVTHNGQRYLPRAGGGRGITKSLVDSYLDTDGQPIASSTLYQGDQSLLDVSTNRDFRLSQTVWITGGLRATGRGDEDEFYELTNPDQIPTAYQIKKGSNVDRNQFYSSAVGTTSSPIFRFAEALLVYAEAKAELGTLTQADVDMSVNVLRDRAGVAHLDLNNITNDPNWQFPSLSPVINEIRRERRVEFAAEGYRFDDLMRWRAHQLFVGKRFKGALFNQADWPDLVVGTNVFLDEDGYLDPHQEQIPAGFEFEIGRDYLIAVPPGEITLNSNLSQNPGWGG